MRVANTRVMLDSVVAAFEQGHSAETIRQQYPTLSLEEVYGAITYYLAYTDEVQQYLRRQEGVWNQWRTKAQPQSNPTIQRLQAMRSASPPESR